MSKIMMWLDSNSRAMIKSNIYVMNQNGVEFVDSLANAVQGLNAECDTIVILEGATRYSNLVNDVKVFKELFNPTIVYMGARNEVVNYLEKYVSVFECSIVNLDWDLVQAAMFQDSAMEDKSSKVNDLAEEAMGILTGQISRTDERVTKVMAHYLSLLEVHKQQENKISALEEKVQYYFNLNEYNKNRQELLLSGYKELFTEAEKLNKVLEHYEVGLTSDINEKVDATRYSERPSIIYVKEYEELFNLEQLLTTLVEVFKLQRRKTVKVVRLYDSLAGNRITCLPDYYAKFYNSFQVSDVLVNDFVAKAGDYRGLLEVLLLNKINLDVLIVVDCRSWNDTVVASTNLNLCTCRDSVSMNKLGLDVRNTIINGNENSNPGCLCWSSYDLRQMSKKEKFVFLSGRPLIHRLLTMYDALG